MLGQKARVTGVEAKSPFRLSNTRSISACRNPKGSNNLLLTGTCVEAGTFVCALRVTALAVMITSINDMIIYALPVQWRY
jgi:hypothetical protein